MTKLRIKNGVSTDFSSLLITSDRIALIPLEDRFAPEMFIEFDSEITKYMVPKPAANIAETYDFIASAKFAMRLGQDLVFAIINKKTVEFLGVCGCHCEGTPDYPELGLWIKKSAHGQKIGRESIVLLVKWLQNNIDYNYLIYPVDRNNQASCSIPEALGGFVFDERKVTSMSGVVLDEVVYKIERQVTLDDASSLHLKKEI